MGPVDLLDVDVYGVKAFAHGAFDAQAGAGGALAEEFHAPGTDAAREHIAREGYDPVYGARPLKRYLQREVETRLSRKLLSGDIPDGSTLTLAYKDGNLDIQVGK